MITKPVVGTLPPWADTGDKTQPSNADISIGFPHTDDKPTRQVMNWALNYTTNGVLYLTRRGIPDWGNQTSYITGDVCRAPNNKFYSAISSNMNMEPSANPAAWQLLYMFPSDLDSVYQTDAEAKVAHDHLQAQIDGITAITGAGYTAGAGISIDTSNVITNTLPHVQPDWNAASGDPAHILNQPPITVSAGTMYMGAGMTSINVQGPALYVVSPDGSRWLAMSTANGQNPVLASSTGIIYNTATNYFAAAGGIFVTSADQTRSLQISMTNTGNPTLASSTNLIVITSGVQVNATFSAYSFGCRAGYGGALSGNGFNINWTGAQADFWIDSAKQGALVLQRVSDSAVVVPSSIDCKSLNISASASGAGYMQLCNNGQFGDGHPWIYSSTGYVICQSSIFYVRGAGFQTNGGALFYSPDVSRSMSISVANGADPVLASTTGVIRCNSVFNLFATSLSVVGTGGLYVWSPDQSSQLRIYAANGADPHIATATPNIYMDTVGGVYVSGQVLQLKSTAASNPATIMFQIAGGAAAGAVYLRAPGSTIYIDQGAGLNVAMGLTVSNGNLSATNFQVPATLTGSGYLQICNNGQTSRSNPWLYSSTGIIETYPGVFLNVYGSLSAVDNASGGALTISNPSGISQINTTNGALNIVNTSIRLISGANSEIRIYSSDNSQYIRFYLNGAQPVITLGNTAGLIEHWVQNDCITAQYGWVVRPSSRAWFASYGQAQGGGGTIFGSNSLLYSNVGITVYSDYRLKTNVETFEGALPLIMKLRPVAFEYAEYKDCTSDGRQHVGFLAHEMQEVLPCAVVGDKDALTKDGEVQAQGVNIWDLVAVLTRAVQELSDKLNEIHPAFN
jgi:hypothetical protein